MDSVVIPGLLTSILIKVVVIMKLNAFRHATSTAILITGAESDTRRLISSEISTYLSIVDLSKQTDQVIEQRITRSSLHKHKEHAENQATADKPLI